MATRAATKRVASKGSGTVAVAPKKVAKKVAPKKVTKVAKPAPVAKKSVERTPRKFNPKTGFVVGSQQDIIATELLKGGASRVEVVNRLKPILGDTTKNGTKKPVGNLVAGVWSVLKTKGYTEVSTYKVRPPKKS